MKKQTIADLSLLLVAFIWGISFLMVQTSIESLEPHTFNGIRFLVAGLFLLTWIFLFQKHLLREMNRSIILSGIVLGIWLFVGYAFQTVGLLYTLSSKAAFITGLSVALVPIFSLLILKQKPKILSIVGVVMAAIGLYFLTVGGSLTLNRGDVLVFFCAIGFALHITFTGKFTKNFSALLLTLIQITTVGILSLFAAVLSEEWQRAFAPEFIARKEVVLSLIITSIFATALAFLAQTNFQKYTSPTRVALIFTMEPVFAAITGVFWAGEELGPKVLLGCFFIFIGMILSELSGFISDKIKELSRGKHQMNS